MLTALSAGAVRRGVLAVAQMFEGAGGNRLTIDFTSAPKVGARILAGEPADIVIASDRVLDTLARASKIVDASRTAVGRTRMAVVMRRGSDPPDLSSTDAFKRAMLEAETLAFNQGSSGAHAAEVLGALGLLELMGGRIRVVRNGAEMMSLITGQSGRVLGLAQVVNVQGEIENGAPVALAGLFPEELQRITSYEVAVSADTREASAVDFIRLFASPDARKLLAATGLD